MNSSGGDDRKPGDRTWWTGRSKMEKALVAASLLAFLVIISLVIGLVAVHSAKSHICETRDCISLANTLQNTLDYEVDPCSDFHGFTCGSPILEDSDSNLVLMKDQMRSMLDEKEDLLDPEYLVALKKMYRACMNETGVELESWSYLKGLIGRAGGWPLMDSYKWKEYGYDWKIAVHKLRKEGYDFPYFLTLSIELDLEDSDKYAIYIDPPNLDDFEEKKSPKYSKYMNDLVRILMPNETNGIRELVSVLTFENSLYELLRSTNKQQKKYKRITITQLQKKYPFIHWYEYLNGILEPSSKVETNDMVYISDEDYLQGLAGLLSQTNKRVLANFISWNVVHHYSDFLGGAAVHKVYEFRDREQPRWEICIDIVNSRLKIPLAAAFLKRHPVSNSSLDSIKNLLEISRKEFYNTIESIKWMDGPTRDFTWKKVSRMDLEIGPEELEDESILNELYSQDQLRGSGLLSLATKMDFLNLNMKYERLHRMSRDYLWSSKVLGLNDVVQYNKQLNTLTFNPLYVSILKHGDISFVTFADLTAKVSGEMAYALTEGQYFDTDGNYQEWKSHASLRKYESALGCFNRMLNNNQDNHEVSGRNILTEFYGLSTAYTAFESWLPSSQGIPGSEYNPNQLFWIVRSMAQCEKHALIDGKRWNRFLNFNERFVEDFKCQVSSYMSCIL